MKKLFLITGLSIALGGCSTTAVQKFQNFSTNYQATVTAINANIAATAPLIAKGCGDLQTAAMLLAPFLPKNAKAPQYFSAANAALNAYCTVIPTDIAGTAKAVAAAVAAAQNGYYQVAK